MFHHLKIGDKVLRLLGGEVEMPLEVTQIKEKERIVVCGAPEMPGGFWEFDMQTGAEIDDDLQWGPKYGATGSFLVKKKSEKK
jgi:hypothetical protein